MRTTLSLLVIVAWAYPLSSGAVGKREPRVAPSVPEALRSWIPWVLQGDEGRAARCPGRVGKKDELSCLWPSRLQLKLDPRGGSFSQEWQVYDAGLVTLPGDKEHWPLEVKLDGKPARVADDEDLPKANLAVGRHVLTGRFSWDSLPESLRIPASTGLTALTIAGRLVVWQSRDVRAGTSGGTEPGPVRPVHGGPDGPGASQGERLCGRHSELQRAGQPRPGDARLPGATVAELRAGLSSRGVAGRVGLAAATPAPAFDGRVEVAPAVASGPDRALAACGPVIGPRR